MIVVSARRSTKSAALTPIRFVPTNTTFKSSASQTSRCILTKPLACTRSPRTPSRASFYRRWLSNQPVHHVAGDIRQAEVAPLKAIGELRMIDAHLVQDRRMQIVHIYRIFADVVAQLVRLAISDAALESAAG